MPAYNFKPQFVDAIRVGDKTQTIRAISKRRHARPGERVGLYVGQRTPDCDLIDEVTCESVETIKLDFTHDTVDVGKRRHINTMADLDEFARRDGFPDWANLKAFFAEVHKDCFPRFTGVLITWRR